MVQHRVLATRAAVFSELNAQSVMSMHPAAKADAHTALETWIAECRLVDESGVPARRQLELPFNTEVIARPYRGSMRRETPRTLGVEEEFHLVDLKTRRLTARAPELLACCPDHVAELQRCVVEMNSGVVDTLEGLRAELAPSPGAVDAAARLGIGVVAAGAVPLSVPAEMQVTQTARYRQMLADYQLLAREQLICGTQVHVDVADRDEAVAVAIACPLSANAAGAVDQLAVLVGRFRHRLLERADAGLAALADDRARRPGRSAAEYDQLVHDLIASGVITDAGHGLFRRPAVDLARRHWSCGCATAARRSTPSC